MVRNQLRVLALLLFLVVAPAIRDDAAAGKPAPGEARPATQSILDKHPITLADLFRLAELNNPTLAAARSAVQARAGRARQAGLYPNPTLGFEVEELSTSEPELRKEKVSLVQPFVLTRRRGNAVAAARAEQDAAAHAFEQARRDVFRRIHTLWAEQLHFREATPVFEELFRVANRTLEIAETRFEARAAPEAQVTKALLEVYDLELAQQQLEREKIRSVAELAAVFGGVRVPCDRLSGTLSTNDLTTSLRTLSEHLTRHPAIRAAEKGVAAAEARLREARAARIPDLGLSVAYGKSRPNAEGFVEFGVSVPLPIFDRNQGRVAESQSLVAQAEHHARFVASQLEVALAAAHARYQVTRDQLAAVHDRIQPAAERGLAQAQEGYRVGRLPFLELLDAQRTLSAVRQRTLELRRDVVVAGAEIMSLAGTGPYGETGEER